MFSDRSYCCRAGAGSGNQPMKSSFIIVADRGNLKAFRVEKVPNGRPPRMQLVQAFTLTAPHLKISEINTDLAGRFPAGSGSAAAQGRHQNAICLLYTSDAADEG